MRKAISGTGCPATDGDLAPVGALIAAIAIAGVFVSPAASHGVRVCFDDRVGGILRPSLLFTGSAP
jgi:hypothetical protein